MRRKQSLAGITEARLVEAFRFLRRELNALSKLYHRMLFSLFFTLKVCVHIHTHTTMFKKREDNTGRMPSMSLETESPNGLEFTD